MVNPNDGGNAEENTSQISTPGGGGGGAKRRTSTTMTPDEQRERRASIKEIMQDQTMTPLERRRSIQSLMDGRRRSSGGAMSAPEHMAGSMSMMAAAAAAAAEFYDSDDDHDESTDENLSLGEADDSLSIASSLSSGRGGRSTDNVSTDGGPSVASSSRGGSIPSRRRTSSGFHRKGRSASLKAFANGAQRVAAAAAAAAAEFSDEPEDILHTAERMERSRQPCSHYERNCTLISPCCGLAFGCRICHDDCPVLPPPSERPPDKTWSNEAHRKKPKVEKRRSLPVDFHQEDTHHTIDRFAIAEIICRKCFTRQSSKTNSCINCDLQFGEYHCSTCNLWMSADEDPYHCLDCGFCRVGGRNNFTHCHDCGMCIDALLFGDHNCKAGKYMSNCPVCQEDLFSSRDASHEMPCGHAIHWHCFRELTSFDTRCPVCKKTAETHDQMAATWSAMAMGIALQPVPPDMARVVNIMCNDCEEPDTDRRWHFLGVQCLKCTSFNTTVKNTTLVGFEAAAYLGDEANTDDLQSSLSAANHHDALERFRNELGSSVGGMLNESSTSFPSFMADDSESRYSAIGDGRTSHERLLSSIQSSLDEAMEEDYDITES